MCTGNGIRNRQKPHLAFRVRMDALTSALWPVSDCRRLPEGNSQTSPSSSPDVVTASPPSKDTVTPVSQPP